MTGQHVIVASLMRAVLLLQPAVVQLAAVKAFVAIPSVHVTHVHAAHSCAHTSDHRDSTWNLDHRFREKPISSKLFERHAIASDTSTPQISLYWQHLAVHSPPGGCHWVATYNTVYHKFYAC